jgi:hypothetical protein
MKCSLTETISLVTEPSKNIIRIHISLLSYTKGETEQYVFQTRHCIIMGNILTNSRAPERIPVRRANLKSIHSYSSYKNKPKNQNFVEIHGWDFTATTGSTCRKYLNHFAFFYWES